MPLPHHRPVRPAANSAAHTPSAERAPRPAPTPVPAARIHPNEGIPARARDILRLDGGAHAPAEARRWTRELLAGWRVDEATANDALLIVSELVTNAVRHAPGPRTILFCRVRGARLTLSVVDSGRRAAPDRAPRIAARASTEEDEGGRGLFLVDLLSVAWGSTPTKDGTVVWARLRVPGRLAASGSGPAPAPLCR
jgi:anti-sigma regulatory factor (Ser/Thr protein kinase)